MNLMNKNDFHIPFIKSLLVVTIVTIFAMVSSRLVINYYMDHINFDNETSIYAIQKSEK